MSSDRFCPRFGDSTSGIEDTIGAGRKTQTFYAGESVKWPPLSGDGSMHTRNLEKGELGSVIFGYNDNTMQECLSKPLFGLPLGHFYDVRNIEEGLPLFLFNYRDRKLHGIYEVASHGRLSFDAYAWTDGGTKKTPFPTQVYIHIKTQCQPLAENQFTRIIADNYFSPQHFWFELDHAQTRGLTALFKPSPSGAVMLPPAVPCRKEFFPALTANNGAQIRNRLLTASPASKWNAIDSKRHLTTEASKPIWDLEPSADIVSESKSGLVHYSGDVSHRSPNKTSCAGFEETDSEGTISDWEELAENNMHNLSLGARLDGANLTSQEQHLSVERLEKVLLQLQKLVAECQSLKPSSNAGSSREFEHNHENAEDVGIPFSSNVNYALSDWEIQQLRNQLWQSDRKFGLLEDHVKEPELKTDPSKLVDESLEILVKQYLGSEAVIYLIGGFDGSSLLSALDSFSPSLDIITHLKSMNSARFRAASVALDGNLFVFGGNNGSSWLDTVEYYNQRHDEWISCPSMLRKKGCLSGATMNGKIFAIGGGDGIECLSDVEMFDLETGKWISNKPMLYKRFSLATAEFKGAIFAVGGYNKNQYLHSAESFDPREGLWTQLPSMKTRRGCHTLAVFNENLYCIGGYDGRQMLSSVEMFEPRVNSWVMGEPLKFCRGYTDAAVLGSSLFAIGGMDDGNDILDTVECYKEGIGWSLSDLKAIGKRCLFSAIVL